MSKSILGEAVEDVQAVKKAAEENAKNLLAEAIAPRIKDFIQAHLGKDEAAEPTPASDEPADDTDTSASEDADTETDTEDDEDPYLQEDESDPDEDDEDEDEEDEEEDDEDSTNEAVERKASESDDAETVEITSDQLKVAFAEVLNAGLKEEVGQFSVGKFGKPQDPNDGEYGLVHKAEGEVQWADAPRVLKKARHAKQVPNENHQKTVQKLQGQLAQYQEAYKYLKKQLSEMHLFNAKLIYTTRLLQNNLSNKQKMAVVESIDKAGNKNEVELVYRTLSESLKIAGVGESRSTVKGPKASRFTKPGSTLTESKAQETSQSNRWAELAGLTK